MALDSVHQIFIRIFVFIIYTKIYFFWYDCWSKVAEKEALVRHKFLLQEKFTTYNLFNVTHNYMQVKNTPDLDTMDSYAK